MKVKIINGRYSQWTMILLMYLISCQVNAQTTAIPDTAFEQKLIALGIDSDGLVNGQILNSDASSIGTLIVDSSGINSLVGIEAFTALSELRCSGNDLTTLDLTYNTGVSTIFCEQNNLININVTSCTNLSVFGCESNNLLYLNLSNCPNVTYLNTRSNLFGLRVCLADPNHPAIPGYLEDNSTVYTGAGCFPKAVQGRVFVDDNNNCTLDPSEGGLTGQIIEFDKGGQKFYFNTLDSTGLYHAYLDTGTYVVSFVSPLNYWQSCQPAQTITVTSSYVLQNINWGLRASVFCPLLEVDIAAPFLRKTGSGSSYTISYCNNGTIIANNAYVEVDLDPFLNVVSTSIPIANQNGNIYTFNIGDVGSSDCGDFTIQVLVDTSALFEQTHCTEVHIYPDSICTNNWLGADLDVVSQCNGDSIWFTIINNGAGMAIPSTYYVFEDNIMMLQDPIQLGAGASMNVTKPISEGRTYRLSVDQESGYPNLLGDPFVTNVREGCAAFPDGSFNTGFVTQFSNGNTSPFIAIDCQENRGSYDPNDKTAQPKGYDATHHYIEDNTVLDYKIRFQNTGTDTAFNIIIIDTLSTHLNIGSLVMGASSHSYTWEIISGNVLKVSFSNIMLPDSNVNEFLSHGFFRYRIEQTPNNPIGTIINNTAAIYFDYNPPIITNTTWHTVGENFVLMTIDPVVDEQLDVAVYPNPFSNQTTLEIKGKEFESLELLIYDATGRLVITQQEVHQNKLVLSRNNLQQGIYFYQLKGNDQLINTGKIVVQ